MLKLIASFWIAMFGGHKKVAVTPVETCVWPHVCVQPVETAQIETCVMPKKCAKSI